MPQVMPPLDERVAAVLADPDAYFAAARCRAQAIAAAEVQIELAARAHARRHPPDAARGSARRFAPGRIG